jgi:16S rRNA (cytosine967-C5)-methyltransferase
VLAAYQLFFLDRVPSFAAVSEAVGAVRAARSPGLAAFVNAVLRRLAEEAATKRPDAAEALRLSVPAWLQRALAASLGGDEEAKAFLAAGTPPSVVRVERAGERALWRDRLAAAVPDAAVEETSASPLGLRLRGAGRITALPGYEEGAWTVQEEGSQLVALALGVRPGEVVLDACAGRGHKTGLLARAGGAVDAADLHPAKLDRLREELTRLGLAARSTFAVDWSRGSGEARPPYDAILLDAPCSGTGTLLRRPDLLLRRRPESVGELATLQLALLRRVAGLLRPGGRLVYAVCSVLREEGEAVVDAALAAEPALAASPFPPSPLRAMAGDAPTFRLLPHRHGTDGYFLASLVRRASGPT